MQIFDADQMTHKMKRQLETEIKILNRINHQCVVDLKDVFEDRDPVIYIVMDILSGPELYDLISENGPFSERESAKVMYQLLSALEYLHKKRVRGCRLKCPHQTRFRTCLRGLTGCVVWGPGGPS